MLFLVSSAHLSTHLTEEESACEPRLIFHYCCTMDLCMCMCVFENESSSHVCMRAFRSACAGA